MKTQLTTEQHN